MRTVRVTRTLAVSPADAERRWYDTSGWPEWVEGLDRVLEVRGDWPDAGATVTWVSGPAGRGRVTERVLTREPLEGQTVEVEDESIRGRQSVSFLASPSGVEISLRLDYELRRRWVLTPIVDVLFIKRAMAASLESTIGRFGARLMAGPATRPDPVPPP